MSRLTKAVSAARSAISHRDDVLKSVATEDMDLFKGVHDAMYHHACHARAADEASWSGGCDDKSRAEAKKHARKHSHLLLRHALESARSRGGGGSSMKYAMQRGADYFTDEASGSDPDGHAKKVKHFTDGGGFVGHKDDKFKED